MPFGSCEKDSEASKCFEPCVNGFCEDPGNYGCDLTENKCVPIDCGAEDACEEDEECAPTTRICVTLPCP